MGFRSRKPILLLIVRDKYLVPQQYLMVDLQNSWSEYASGIREFYTTSFRSTST